MADENKTSSNKSNSFSRKKLDDANLQYIESLVDKNVKAAAGGNTVKKKATKPKPTPAKEQIKPDNQKNKPAEAKKKNIDARISRDMGVEDLESINEENVKKQTFRTRRNRLIIAILIILLLLTVGGFAIFYFFAKQENNAFLYVHGDIDASYYLDNEKLEKFRTTPDMRGNAIFHFSKKAIIDAPQEERYLQLKIEESGNFKIKFKIDVYQNDVKLDNVAIVEWGELFKTEGEYCVTRYSSGVSGGKLIKLCIGFDARNIDDNNPLNENNCRIEVHTYIERIS